MAACWVFMYLGNYYSYASIIKVTCLWFLFFFCMCIINNRFYTGFGLIHSVYLCFSVCVCVCCRCGKQSQQKHGDGRRLVTFARIIIIRSSGPRAACHRRRRRVVVLVTCVTRPRRRLCNIFAPRPKMVRTKCLNMEWGGWIHTTSAGSAMLSFGSLRFPSRNDFILDTYHNRNWCIKKHEEAINQLWSVL